MNVTFSVELYAFQQSEAVMLPGRIQHLMMGINVVAELINRDEETFWRIRVTFYTTVDPHPLHPLATIIFLFAELLSISMTSKSSNQLRLFFNDCTAHFVAKVKEVSLSMVA